MIEARRRALGARAVRGRRRGDRRRARPRVVGSSSRSSSRSSSTARRRRQTSPLPSLNLKRRRPPRDSTRHALRGGSRPFARARGTTRTATRREEAASRLAVFSSRGHSPGLSVPPQRRARTPRSSPPRTTFASRQRSNTVRCTTGTSDLRGCCGRYTSTSRPSGGSALAPHNDAELIVPDVHHPPREKGEEREVEASSEEKGELNGFEGVGQEPASRRERRRLRRRGAFRGEFVGRRGLQEARAALGVIRGVGAVLARAVVASEGIVDVHHVARAKARDAPRTSPIRAGHSRSRREERRRQRQRDRRDPRGGHRGERGELVAAPARGRLLAHHRPLPRASRITATPRRRHPTRARRSAKRSPPKTPKRLLGRTTHVPCGHRRETKSS